MQDTKRFEDQHPAAGPGLSSALGSLRKVGEEEQAHSEGLYMLAWGGGDVKQCGEVKVGLR